MAVLIATSLYFTLVFLVGLVMGPIRAEILEPRFGPLIAVTIEAPVLLATIVWAARLAPRAAQLSTRPLPLLAVGFGALALQQLADIGVGFARGLSLVEQFAQFATPQGWVYAGLLAAFALMPWLLNGAMSSAGPEAR